MPACLTRSIRCSKRFPFAQSACELPQCGLMRLLLVPTAPSLVVCVIVCGVVNNRPVCEQTMHTYYSTCISNVVCSQRSIPFCAKLGCTQTYLNRPIFTPSMHCSNRCRCILFIFITAESNACMPSLKPNTMWSGFKV